MRWSQRRKRPFRGQRLGDLVARVMSVKDKSVWTCAGQLRGAADTAGQLGAQRRVYHHQTETVVYIAVETGRSARRSTSSTRHERTLPRPWLVLFVHRCWKKTTLSPVSPGMCSQLAGQLIKQLRKDRGCFASHEWKRVTISARNRCLVKPKD